MSDSAVPRPVIKPPRAVAAAQAAAAAAQAAAPRGATLPGAPSGRMSLTKVISGRIAKPMRVLLYGIEGVGKSTFAAGAPSPIFLGAEDGTSELDVQRFPQPQHWTDVMEAVAELTTAEHAYKTLVIDTIDWLEPLCWAEVCRTCPLPGKRAGVKARSIEDYGFGAGYTEATGVWRQLIAALERLRAERQMDIVLLGHSWIRPFKNPTGSDYDRWETRLHKTAAGIWREWCDAVLFAAHDVSTYEDDRKRTKGISKGARILYTRHDAAWDAKNRYDLPASLPLDYGAFAEAVAAHRPDDPERLRAQIERMLAEVTGNDQLTTRVRNSVANAGDNAGELARIANKLAAQLAITPHDEETSP